MGCFHSCFLRGDPQYQPTVQAQALGVLHRAEGTRVGVRLGAVGTRWL